MNIYAKNGDKVMVTKRSSEHGREYNREDIKELCELNVPYTVDHTNVGQSHTSVYLKEFPNKCFNSANFQDCTSEGELIEAEVESTIGLPF